MEPGEIVEISRAGILSVCKVPLPLDKKPALCLFEYVYFARSDSILEGQSVYTVRFECGKQMARESPVEADIVSSVPESGTAAALGFSMESGIPFAEVFCKSRYIGRSFIEPSTRLRQLAIAKKLAALPDNVAGKRVILIDDSIVRGNTVSAIIKLLKDAGAKEVHIRVASPPLHHPCFMGVNIPTKSELIANRMDKEEIIDFVDANSLEYLSLEGLEAVVSKKSVEVEKVDCGGGHCTACMTGKYPVDCAKIDW